MVLSHPLAFDGHNFRKNGRVVLKFSQNIIAGFIYFKKHAMKLSTTVNITQEWINTCHQNLYKSQKFDVLFTDNHTR
jgi:hypothetical protein